MSGGNYYLSMRQLLENEKRVRIISLVRFSQCSFEGLKAASSTDDGEVRCSFVIHWCWRPFLADFPAREDSGGRFAAVWSAANVSGGGAERWQLRRVLRVWRPCSISDAPLPRLQCMQSYPSGTGAVAKLEFTCCVCESNRAFICRLMARTNLFCVWTAPLTSMASFPCSAPFWRPLTEAACSSPAHLRTPSHCAATLHSLLSSPTRICGKSFSTHNAVSENCSARSWKSCWWPMTISPTSVALTCPPLFPAVPPATNAFPISFTDSSTPSLAIMCAHWATMLKMQPNKPERSKSCQVNRDCVCSQWFIDCTVFMTLFSLIDPCLPTKTSLQYTNFW